jgi:hypothetical protein
MNARPAWRKSSRSGPQGGDCVELARLGSEIGIRDSKNPAAGHLSVSARTFHALVSRIKTGALEP